MRDAALTAAIDQLHAAMEEDLAPLKWRIDNPWSYYLGRRMQDMLYRRARRRGFRDTSLDFLIHPSSNEGKTQ